MDNKFIKLVEKKRWKKLRKIAEGKSNDDIVAVAAACSTGRDEEAYNLLVDLLSHKDLAVKIAAINALGDCRYSVTSQITRLLWIADNSEEPEIKEAVSQSVSKLRDSER